MQLSHVTAFWLRLAGNILLDLFLHVHTLCSSVASTVLVQPEMERWRFPLASIPSFGGDFQGIDTTTRVSLSMIASPQSLLPFPPGKVIVVPSRPSVSTSG